MKIKKINLCCFLSIVFVATAMFSCDDMIDDQEDNGSDDVISANITESVVWKAGETYIIDGTVRVGAATAVTITIEPGATIKFNEGANLDLAYSNNTYATIKALGTKDNPITFKRNGSNNWGSIRFFNGAINSEFTYCVFDGGGANDYYGNLYLNDAKVAFADCMFKNSASNGIILSDASFENFANNSFSETYGAPISIYPEAIHTIGEGNVYEAGQKIIVKGQDFTTAGDYIWKKQGAPYLFEGSLRIGSDKTSGVNITVEPGVVFLFANNVYVDFAYWDDTYVSFVAIGTDKDPIVFTSASPNKEAGDWKSLNFYDGAIDCEFDFCEFLYGGAGNYGMINIQETMLSITNSSISFSANNGIEAREGAEFFNFHRNDFHDNALYPILIYPNGVYSMGPENTFENGDAIYVSNDEDLTMNGEFTWLNQTVPYIIAGNMRIGSVKGTFLNINSGTVLKFTDDALIQVAYWDENSGKIVSKGTELEPVIFTSNSPSPAKGDWKGISLYNGSEGTKLDHCIIDYAGGLRFYGAVNLFDAGMNVSTIAHTTISNSLSYGIRVDDKSSIDYSTVTFLNNDGIDYDVD